MTEAEQERVELLNDLLTSQAWRVVVTPVLTLRLRELERRALSAKTLEDLRIFQGGHRVLASLLEDPKGFFDLRGEKE